MEKLMFVSSPAVDEKTLSSSPGSSCCLQVKWPFFINTSGGLDTTRHNRKEMHVHTIKTRSPSKFVLCIHLSNVNPAVLGGGSQARGGDYLSSQALDCAILSQALEIWLWPREAWCHNSNVRLPSLSLMDSFACHAWGNVSFYLFSSTSLGHLRLPRYQKLSIFRKD